jgi:predicted metalloprotease with PDZ domain/catechol 2,3-dioxygenase-like lactoylglutathione lyase family enzyme
MRTALAPHTRRIVSILLIGLLTAAAAAQNVATPPAAAGQPAGPNLDAPPNAAKAQAPAQTQTAPAAPAGASQGAAAAAPAPAPVPIVPEKAPIIHSLSFPDPAAHTLVVQSAIPTDGKSSIELMMSVWTPGFYRVENYARSLLDFSARLPNGEPLTVEKPADNRWRINTQGEPLVIVTYRLVCERGSVSRSVVNEEYAVICGGPTYLTLVNELDRPHEVHLNLPSSWAKSATGLGIASDGRAHHYRAKDFDTLMDCPIAVGNLSIHSFAVNGSRHHLVDIGNAADMVNWDGEKRAADLEIMVSETRNFWGFLPFEDYFFLNKLARGGGGLEHLNSTLIHTAPPRRPSTRRDLRWLQFVAHEYFHTFNVKRLRPVELGPFDYENARRTSGLWVGEGLTNYFNSLIVARSGLGTADEYLAALSAHIRTIQNAPGRLVQSLAASSLETWTGDGFGGGRGRDSSISYYNKGPIVGFLLDAKIRRATGDKQSLDDVMRLAYARYAGVKGYTEQEFLDTAQDIAGIDLKEFFDKNLFSTEETDYTDALDWFGLRFQPNEDDPSTPIWRLQVNPDATDEQKAHFASYLAPSMAPSLLAKAAPPETKAEPAPAKPKGLELVEGIGGIFIYSNDATRLAEWYQKNLGLEGTKFEQDGAFVFAFKYRRNDDPNAETETVWAILPSTEERVASPAQYQLNYRVKDMDRMLEHLRASGVPVEKTENHSYGRFAWVRDPDGNRVELFQKANKP